MPQLLNRFPSRTAMSTQVASHWNTGATQYMPDDGAGDTCEMAAQPLTTFLGLFSIGLGLWEVLAPRSVANRTGVRYLTVLQMYGLREIAAGIGILSSRRPAGWLWARVAGDVLDIATLLAEVGDARGDQKRRLMTSLGAVACVTALDVYCAHKHGSMGRGTCKS
jgi:hypothetical protein